MDNARILLVDDQVGNISVLYDLLSQEGYQLYIATNGKDVVPLLEQNLPDLILLDVMMPGLNGFEVCRQLKNNPQYAKIPVIFMTALDSAEDRLEGFAAGGVDYITKPFHQAEVLARVRSQLTIALQYQELQQKNLELEQKNQELDAFSHTVAHDLRNPLNNIMGYAELLDFKCESHDAEIVDALNSICKTTMKLSDIIEALLLLAGTSGHQTPCIDYCDMGYIIKKVKDRMAFELKHAGVVLKYPAKWPFIKAHPAWLEEVWVNYISNALKYGGQPTAIELGFDELDSRVRFWVRDNGPGLTPEQQAKLFVPFIRLHKDRADGHGLGLSIVLRIVEKLGGKVGVDSELGSGSRFYFELLK